MNIKSRAELLRAIKLPDITIRVLMHWQPQLENTARKPLQFRKNGRPGVQTNGYWFDGLDYTGKPCEMWASIPSAKELEFNEDGSVTWFPDTAKSWTLAFIGAGEV